MTSEYEVSQDYTKPNKLVLCSNTLIDVNIPFLFENNIPLLIGQNDDPQVWLQARSGNQKGQWVVVVEKNEGLHESIKVTKDKNGKVVIHAKDTKVLEVEKHQDHYEVIDLDMRPLGLNIHGNETMLMIGNTQMSQNTFQDAEVMISIGEDGNT